MEPYVPVEGELMFEERGIPTKIDAVEEVTRIVP